MALKVRHMSTRAAAIVQVNQSRKPVSQTSRRRSLSRVASGTVTTGESLVYYASRSAEVSGKSSNRPLANQI